MNNPKTTAETESLLVPTPIARLLTPASTEAMTPGENQFAHIDDRNDESDVASIAHDEDIHHTLTAGSAGTTEVLRTMDLRDKDQTTPSNDDDDITVSVEAVVPKDADGTEDADGSPNHKLIAFPASNTGDGQSEACLVSPVSTAMSPSTATNQVSVDPVNLNGGIEMADFWLEHEEPTPPPDNILSHVLGHGGCLAVISEGDTEYTAASSSKLGDNGILPSQLSRSDGEQTPRIKQEDHDSTVSESPPVDSSPEAETIARLRAELEELAAQEASWKGIQGERQSRMTEAEVAVAALHHEQADNEAKMKPLRAQRSLIEGKLKVMRYKNNKLKEEEAQCRLRLHEHSEAKEEAVHKINALSWQKMELEIQLKDAEHEMALRERFPDAKVRELARRCGWGADDDAEHGNTETGVWAALLADGEGATFDDLLEFREELFEVDNKIKKENGDVETSSTSSTDRTGDDSSFKIKIEPDASEVQVKTEFADNEEITFDMVQNAVNMIEAGKRQLKGIYSLLRGTKRVKSEDAGDGAAAKSASQPAFKRPKIAARAAERQSLRACD